MFHLSIPDRGGNGWKYLRECLDTNWISSSTRSLAQTAALLASRNILAVETKAHVST